MARLRGFCVMSLGGPCEVTTLPTFWHAIGRKRGPGGDYTWEPGRLSSVRSSHLTVVLCVRPCSQTTRLPCVAEGGSFFTAAGTGSDRSPSETMQRYAFPRVRRASASGARCGKGLFYNVFSNASSVWWKMSHFWPSRASLCLSCRRNVVFAP